MSTENITSPETLAESAIPEKSTWNSEDYAAQLAAKRRKEQIRNWSIGVVIAIAALIASYLIKGAVDDDNKLEASQIAAAQKFGDDRGWNHTGSWRIDDLISTDNVVGQVSLGTCVYDVKSPAERPHELQVFLPEVPVYSNYDSAKRPAFRPFLVSELTAAAAETNKWNYRVEHCFYKAVQP